MDRLVNKRADVVILDRGNGTTCSVNLHGATIVSWKLNYIEKLFVSKLARFDNMWPIRGGINIIFPQYGYDNMHMPNHGFARINKWEVLKKPQIFPKGDVEAVFYLNANSVLPMNDWEHSFELIYKVVLLEFGLELNMIVHNLSESTFRYNFAFHPYFKVPDVSKYEIVGLKGSQYCDKAKLTSTEDKENKLVIREWTDRIYRDTLHEICLKSSETKSKIKLKKKNLPDVVIWHPWSTKAEYLSHFDEEEYKKMICIVPGYINTKFDLNPGLLNESVLIFEAIE